MPLIVKHNFVSAKGDGPDPTQIQPSHWNDSHTLSGSISIAAVDGLTVALAEKVGSASLVTALAPYLTSASAASAYQPTGDYVTSGSISTMIAGQIAAGDYVSSNSISAMIAAGGGGVASLGAVGDVVVSASLAANEIIQWSGTAWITRTLSEAGIQPAGDYVGSASLVTTLGTYITSTSLGTALAPYLTSTSAATAYQPAGDYVTSTSLGTVLATYVTSASLGTALAPYLTSGSAATAYQPAGDYVGSASLQTTLATYVTSASLGTALAAYLTSGSAATAYQPVGDYVGSASLQTTLATYITSASLGTALAPYLTSGSAATAYQAAGDYVTSNSISTMITTALSNYDASNSVSSKIATALGPYITSASASAGYVPQTYFRLTAGYESVVTSDGTVSSGSYIPVVTSGTNFKVKSNGGAFTLTPPTLSSLVAVEMTLLIRNTTGAGAITTSNFTSTTGDAFDTSVGSEFLCRLQCFHDGSAQYSNLDVVALQ